MIDNNYSKEKISETIDYFNKNTNKIMKLINTECGKENYSMLSDYFTNINQAMSFLHELQTDGRMFSQSMIERSRKKYFNLYNDLVVYKKEKFSFDTMEIDNNDYMEFLLEVIKARLTDLGLNLETGNLFSHEVPKFNELDNNDPIYKYVSKNPTLMMINKQRIRNITVFDNENHEVIYDLYTKDVSLRPKIHFSDIEHDTNRKFVENVVLNIMYNFNNKKEHYLKLLLNKPRKYKDQIEIIKGEKQPTDTDILVLISLLGRLEQENQMGPITVRRKEKLNPELIVNHNSNINYIRETIKTFSEYQNTISTNNDLIKLIPNYNFNLINDHVSNSQLLLPIMQETQIKTRTKTKVSTNIIKGTVESPNYLLSFFKKFVEYHEFKDIIPLYNSNETLSELIEYSKRFRGNPNEQDFAISAKTRSILKTADKKQIFDAIIEVFKTSRTNTYSKRVSNHILSQEGKVLKELLKLFLIFENSVQEEKQRYMDEMSEYFGGKYNDSYMSVASDMHLNNLERFQKSNFSKNFNIVAGDFIDNLFHRGGVELEGVVKIPGVGVIGNHDILLQSKPTQDLKKEIKTNFKDSIKNLAKLFPDIKILNDEIIYKNGYAIIGMTLFYDQNKGQKTFFANSEWGQLFNSDDYIMRAKSLLNKVDKNTPIIFVSHSPFKEYSVAKNKEIGVPSNYIFRNYPNVKVYVHGHGHSTTNIKKIENVLCISNPIVMNKSIMEKAYSKDELKQILGLEEQLKINN